MNVIKISDWVSKALMVLAAAWTIAISVLVLADIIGRGAFDFPIHGTAEMVAASIVIIVFLQTDTLYAAGIHAASGVFFGDPPPGYSAAHFAGARLYFGGFIFPDDYYGRL